MRILRVDRRVISAGIGLLLVGIMSSDAFAFGTTAGKPGLSGWYFYKEHANIVTAALSCAAADPVVNCFEPDSMLALSGNGDLTGLTGGFGAVGAADNYSYDASGPTEWHCAEADYIPPTINGVPTGINNYPTSESYAKGVFNRCRNFVKNEFTEGDPIGTQSNPPGKWGGVLGSARYYFTKNNSYSGDLTWAYAGAGLSGAIGYATLKNCVYSYYNASGGKCHVLNALGRGLHVVMDFYAHSNWGDVADPSRPISINNPPGLGQTTLPPFWADLDQPMPWTEGLSSGCFGKEYRGLEGTAANANYADCTSRAPDTEWRGGRYEGYSKDVSNFDPRQGSLAVVTCNDVGDIASGSWRGCMPRGSLKLPGGRLVEQNVTTLAILEVRRQWAWVQRKIYEKFGNARGATVICYITKDEVKQCSAN